MKRSSSGCLAGQPDRKSPTLVLCGTTTPATSHRRLRKEWSCTDATSSPQHSRPQAHCLPPRPRRRAQARMRPTRRRWSTYHLCDFDKVGFVLGNIKNHFDGVGGPEHVTIALVVHGPALKAHGFGQPRHRATHRAICQSRTATERVRQYDAGAGHHAEGPTARVRCGRSRRRRAHCRTAGARVRVSAAVGAGASLLNQGRIGA